jgi:hypothetical protein
MAFGGRVPVVDRARGIVVLESLRGGRLPSELSRWFVARSTHLLEPATPITIAELSVAANEVPAAVAALSSALLSPGWYGHFLDQRRMIVVFPGEHYVIPRGDGLSAHVAQRAGRRHGIPMSQMRFPEMFDKDHPDAS